VRHLGVVLLLAPLAFAIDAVGSSADEGFTPSEELSELLLAPREDGEPLIGPREREYFDELPARAKELFNEAIESELLSETGHLKEILSLGLPAAKIELLMQDNCLVCHTDPTAQDPETLFSTDPESSGSPPHLDLEEFLSDAHFRRDLSCAGCHGGDPTDEDMADEIYERWPEAPERHEDRTWIPDFCARCHADPIFMRRFNPALPTDQHAKYKESRHGERLFREGDSKAAQCVSCPLPHGIRGPKSPRSSVHPQKIPYTCGGCHADDEYMKGYVGSNGEPLPTDQLELFEASVHGRALLDRGDLGAPACNDCHGNHAAMPPEISSIAQVCRTCHAGNGELFDGSSHKKAFERHGWPECEKCHGNHAIAEADDSMLSEQSSPLCYECHREYAEDNPSCVETARYFHASIASLADESESLDRLIDPLARRGLDVDALTAAVGELRDILRESRSQIHAFDRGEFAALEARGRKKIETSQALVTEAEEEYRFRRNGLLVAVGIMIFLAAIIYLKIREVDAHA
jgi:predicted CXXCH cytochrome family protein